MVKEDEVAHHIANVARKQRAGECPSAQLTFPSSFCLEANT